MAISSLLYFSRSRAASFTLSSKTDLAFNQKTSKVRFGDSRSTGDRTKLRDLAIHLRDPRWSRLGLHVNVEEKDGNKENQCCVATMRLARTSRCGELTMCGGKI